MQKINTKTGQSTKTQSSFKAFMFILFLGGTSFCLSAASLIKDGQAYGRIYAPRLADRPVLMAIRELQTHLKAMTGAEMKLAWRDHRRYCPGITLSVRPEKEWLGKESAQAFTITEVEKPRPEVRITGNTGIAVLYGVYQYLNDQGIRWFEPGKIGTNIPKKTDLAVKARVFKGSPSFIYRCLDFSSIDRNVFSLDPVRARKLHDEWDLWLLRNRLIFDRTIHYEDYFAFNKMASPMSHDLPVMCKLYPKNLKKEPERFALVTRGSKKIRTAVNAQVCFSNETNISCAIESAVERLSKLEKTKKQRNSDLDEVNDAASMTLADCRGICECDNCNKIAGKGPNSKDRLVWYFMNRVAKGLNTRMPGKKIMLFTPYFELTRPPSDVKIEPNIIAIACRSLGYLDVPESKECPLLPEYKKNVEATAKAGAQMMTYDYILCDAVPQPLNIFDAAKYYADHGFKRYHGEVMQRNELLWPVLWTLAQFIWDSKQDPYQLLKEYCNEYYGSKNGPLILDLIKQIDSNGKKIQRIIYGGPADLSYMLTDELISKYRPLLDEAVKRSGGKEQERIRRFRLSFEAQMFYAELYRSLSKALNERSSESIKNFKKRCIKYERFFIDNDLVSTNAPFQMRSFKKIAKTDFTKLAPKGRKITKENLLKELFAGTTVPAKIDNLFMLPENWKLQLDIHNNGLKQGWEKIGFNDEKWPLVSTWDAFESQGYTGIDGRFWYRLSFKAPEFPKGKRVILRIGSLDDDGEVYVNGKMVYRRLDRGMWDKSFAVDITDAIVNGGKNLIAVRGYDATGAGGIWRPSAIYTKNK